MKQILCFIIVCLINVGFAFPQSHFTKIWTGNGLDHMNFYALSPTINGEPLQVDDEIAIFDGENCVGFKKITKLSNIVSIITSSDDTKPVGIIEGFRVGNRASIKIWDASLKIEISDIAITVVKGSLIFAPSETVEFTIECIPPAIPMVGIITQPTCSLTTGSVVLSGLPTGSWTINPGAIAGNTTSTTITGLAAGTYNFTVTNTSSCISQATSNVLISSQPAMPAIPMVGSITQPTCSLAIGSVVLSGLPTGSWIINPGAITGTSTSTTIPDLAVGTYNFTVTNASGCVSTATSNVLISSQPAMPAIPMVGTITQPTCSLSTGSVVLSGLPTGSWTINPGAITGTTTSITVTDLTVGTYNFTVTNASGCVSTATADVVISSQPGSPTVPMVGTITQPTCSLATGSVVLSGLPTGNWTINPGAITGNTTSTTVTELAVGTYNFTVTNASGCISTATADVLISSQPLAPTVETASVTPTSVIGSGQVIFSATANSGTIKWFDAATGGTEVTVLNPTINATTTYYAEAISPEGCISVSRTAVTATVIPLSIAKELSYRFANPRIINGLGFDSFEFDVQVKADEAGTYLWSGQINLSLDNMTLSTDQSQWFITKTGLFNTTNSHGNAKYVANLSIAGTSPGKVLNINYAGDAGALHDPATAVDFMEVTTTYQTIVSMRGRILSNIGTAGIDFIETTMNEVQNYKLSQSPYYAGYKNPNMYDQADFMDTYVGRVHATLPGWTQIEGLNWANSVNTSVWEGDAMIPDGSLSNASALRIHSPATLTIPVNSRMTVTGDTEIKTANGLTLQSDASGTGSLITETASGVGSALVHRFMTTSAWHFVSSPLSGQSITNFLTTNAAIATSEDELVRGMMDFNSTLNEWNEYFTNVTSGNLETGKGFSMRTNANTSVSFTGLLQAGNQSASGLTPEMWNCIGNPYTSALGINTQSSSTTNFLDTNIDNLDPLYSAIYLWDQPDASNGVGGGYTVISNVSDPFDVQQGQAYLVKLNSAATSIHFNSAMQIHNPGLALKSTKGLWSTIKLSATVNNENSSAIIAFNSGMTKGLDPTYDAGLLKGSSDLLIYSRLVEDNGIPFAIQALPADDYSRMIIPLGLDFKTGGQVVFSAELINLPSDCQVILEDKLSKTFTDLSKKVFTIAIAANSSISDRFYLHTSYQTTNLELETLPAKLSAYAIRNVEMIVKGEVSDQAVASLYDVMGRLVLTHKLKTGSTNTIGLPMIKTGIYMLYVKQNGKVQGFKVPVKE